MLLRPFSKADLPALYALDQVCFAPDIAYSQRELRFFLEHPRTFTMVAEQAGQVTGFCICERFREAGRLAGRIITIDVAPHERRAGVGARLLEAVEERLRQEQASMLVLEVAVDNQGAQRFYEKHGFVVTGRIRGYYAGRLDAFTMRKALEPPQDASISNS